MMVLYMEYHGSTKKEHLIRLGEMEETQDGDREEMMRGWHTSVVSEIPRV